MKGIRWLKFFLGTPKRFAIAVALVAFWAMWFDPRHTTLTLERLVNASTPIVGLVLAIMIVWIGFKKIVS